LVTTSVRRAYLELWTMDWYEVRGILKIKGFSTIFLKISKLSSKNIIVKMVPQTERYT
jgi:hypothetical protein